MRQRKWTNLEYAAVVFVGLNMNCRKALVRKKFESRMTPSHWLQFELTSLGKKGKNRLWEGKSLLT